MGERTGDDVVDETPAQTGMVGIGKGTGMAENRRLFIANRTGIRVYEVLKETPLMFRVKGLTDSAWEHRIYKDHSHIRWTLEDAREDLRKQLTEQVKGQEEDLAKTREVLAKVGQIEPQYSK